MSKTTVAILAAVATAAALIAVEYFYDILPSRAKAGR